MGAPPAAAASRAPATRRSHRWSSRSAADTDPG